MKSLLRWAVLLAGLCALNGMAGNFVYNNSFETASGGFAADFSTLTNNCTFIHHVTWDSAGARSGTNYVKLRGLFGDTNWLFQTSSAAVPVITGTQYEVSAWIKRQAFNAAYSIQLVIAWRDVGGTYLSSDSQTLSGFSGTDSAYTNMIFRATAPANAESAVLKLWIRKNAGPSTSNVYVSIDDVAIEDYAYVREDIAAIKDPACWAAGSNLISQIESAANNSTININPGYYCFSRDFEIRNKTNITVRATNTSGTVKFIFDTARVTNAAISIIGSTNIYMSGFSIDYYPPVTSQGKIVSWNVTNNTVVIDVDPGFSKPTTAWITSADFGKVDDPKALLFDRSSRLLKNIENDYAIAGAASASNEFRYTISLNGASGGGGTVDMFEMESLGYTNKLEAGDSLTFARRCHSTFYVKSEHVVLSNLTFYGSGNAAIVSGYATGNHLLSHLRVIRKPDTKRLLVSCCEAVHMVGDLIAPVITNCVFEHMGDDGINVDSHINIVGDTPSTITITNISLATNQLIIVQKDSRVNAGIVAGGVLSFFGPLKMDGHGWHIGILSAIELTGYASNYVTVADNISSNYGNQLLSLSTNLIKVWKVTLATSVAATGIQRLDFVSPEDDILSGLVIVNTTINDANGHGIIVAAHDSLIESNTISNVGRAAISFAPYMLWLEGAFPKNVTVANNLIEDSMRMKIRTGERKCGGIVVSCLPRYFVTNTAQEAVSRILTNIEVVSNTVRRCGYTPIVIKNAYNPVVTDNVIDTPMHSPTGMLATLNFSSGGFDQGFNCGIYYNNTTGCSTGGNSFVNLNGYAAQYIGPDNTGLH